MFLRRRAGFPRAWPKGEKPAGPLPAPSWPPVCWWAGRGLRIKSSSRCLWRWPIRSISVSEKKWGTPFARRFTRSVMAEAIDFISPRRARPFTIWEAMPGRGALRSAASERGSLLKSFSISKKRNHPVVGQSPMRQRREGHNPGRCFFTGEPQPENFSPPQRGGGYVEGGPTGLSLSTPTLTLPRQKGGGNDMDSIWSQHFLAVC